VALDATLKPRPIPPVTFETEEEKRRNSEAAERRRTRLEQKGKGHKQNRKTG